MSKVALVRCETYQYAVIKKAVENGISLLGGVEKFAEKGEKILLKPNMLAPDPPEKCVTTNPAVLKAVAEIFMTTGAMVSFGDSPGIGSTLRTAKKAGLWDVAQELNIQMSDFKTGREVFFHKENKIKNLLLPRRF